MPRIIKVLEVSPSFSRFKDWCNDIVNYIGRKFSLLDFLGNEMRRRISPDCRVFFDVFAGTGVVGKQKDPSGT